MSLPTLAYMAESGLSDPNGPPGALDNVIRQSIDKAVRNIALEPDALSGMGPAAPFADPTSSSHPLYQIQELGKALARTTRLWAQVTDSLATGPHVQKLMSDAHERSVAESNMYNYGPLADLDMNISRLQKSRELAAQHSREMLALWYTEQPVREASPNGFSSANTSFFESRHTNGSRSLSTTGDFGDPRAFKSRKTLPDKGHQFAASSPVGDASSDDSDDDSDGEQFSAIDMNALMQRGKGSYTCPKGPTCTKGGVDPHTGDMVIFDRNSSFKQHCNKHLKPYRCDMPGCPNQPHKRKFARRDGLERHKNSVKHEIKPEYITT